MGDDRRRLAGLSDDTVGRLLNDVVIRPATVADVDDIAALHAARWRSAYRGILGEHTLGPALDGDRLIHRHGELATLAPRDAVLIAPGVGFVAVWGKAIRALAPTSTHIHPERRSAGLGRRLLGEAMRRVARRDEAGAWPMRAEQPNRSL